MRKRTGLILAVALVGALALTALVSYGVAGPPKGNLKSKRMSSYLEVPSISTTARGRHYAACVLEMPRVASASGRADKR